MNNRECIAATPAEYDGRVIVDSRYAKNFEESMFGAAYWRDKQAIVGDAGGRGRVFYLQCPDHAEQWVLRHYHRGGMMTPALGDRYLWTGMEKTRSIREWNLLATLYMKGLPVPRPVAARYQQDGLFYQADLITVRIPEARSLASIVTETLPAEPFWKGIGQCIRRFHDASVYHADLNAHNIVLDQSGTVFLVDFDRGRLRAGERWKKANLKRLNRSLHKIGVSLAAPQFQQHQWQELIAGYNEAG